MIAKTTKEKTMTNTRNRIKKYKSIVKLKKFTLTGAIAAGAVSLKVTFLGIFASVEGATLASTLICTLPFCALFFFSAVYLITDLWSDV